MTSQLTQVGVWITIGTLVACGARIEDQGPRAHWARTGASRDAGSFFDSAAVDRSANVYAAGYAEGPGTLDLGDGVIATATDDSTLLVKYDPAGTAQWARSTTGSRAAAFRAVAVDPSDDIYAAGSLPAMLGTVSFGNGVTLANSDTFLNAMLVKYDSSGMAQWARAATAGSGDCSFRSVAVDTSGNVYVAGEIEGTATYDFGSSVTLTGIATNDRTTTPASRVMLVKYDSSGTAQWARTVTAGSLGSSFSSVAVDAAGNVYAAGAVAGTETYDFGNGARATGTAPNGGPVAGMLSSNVLVVKYSSAGIAEWARTLAAGASSSSLSSVAVDSAGSVYAAGVIGDGPCDFGNGVIAEGTLERGALTGTVGPTFAVLVKYDASGVAQWVRTVATGGPHSSFDSVAVTPSGSAYVAGSVYGKGTYDFGNGAAIASHADGTNCVLLVKYDAHGVAEWARSSQNGASVLVSVAVDAAGGVYAAGGVGEAAEAGFGNGITIRGTNVVAALGWSALLVKYQ